MIEPENRPSQAPSNAVRVNVLTVPRTGIVVVRFLSEASSMWTHFNHGSSLACAGEGRCPPNVHRVKIVWKAYAAVEYKMAREPNKWFPAVLEITEGLSQFVGDENRRGEVWQLFRERISDKRSECRGRFVRADDPRKLRTDIPVAVVVEHLYRTTDIAWNVGKPYGERVWLSPTVDQGDASLDGNSAHPTEEIQEGECGQYRPKYEAQDLAATNELARKLLKEAIEQTKPKTPKSE